MTNALVERPVITVAPTVTNEQLDLIRRTVAKDATPDELKLYLYDCSRQGVHPLDKLIHFTKRSGKYTPVTSIDFMRTRAADTGEYAGSDDAVFYPPPPVPQSAVPDSATVTVWRIVQGQRCSFTATARWNEYKPEQNDFMWRKMPFTMLGKCAEALALRKGFPRQLAGLYASEELDQAHGPVLTPLGPRGEPGNTAVPNVGELGTTLDTTTGEVLDAPPAGYHYVANYELKNGWHEADLLNWDAQGGALHVSSKTKQQEGAKLGQAANFNIPAKVDVTMKPQSVGQAYFNKVELLKAEVVSAPVDASEISF